MKVELQNGTDRCRVVLEAQNVEEAEFLIKFWENEGKELARKFPFKEKSVLGLGVAGSGKKTFEGALELSYEKDGDTRTKGRIRIPIETPPWSANQCLHCLNSAINGGHCVSECVEGRDPYPMASCDLRRVSHG